MNSLIIATGSNLGDKLNNLFKAKNTLNKLLTFVSQSRVFTSEAILYCEQPDFYNQVLEYEIPSNLSPQVLMAKILEVEQELGRTRDIDKGARTIDIDIIFWGTQSIQEPSLIIPHYDWENRSFIVRPLHDLTCFKSIKKCFKIPTQFKVEAKPI
jgi:2-amino-4-hydroxy-6-hydroxymethyldihydropteridine diphosphokinase